MKFEAEKLKKGDYNEVLLSLTIKMKKKMKINNLQGNRMIC